MNEFFDITRFSLTNLTLEPKRVNLSRMLEQITYEFNPILMEKELSWNLIIRPDIELFCDPDKLERVFDNLIRNAVNYSYQGTDIYLSLEQNNDYIRVRVQNQGKTIPPEKLEKIFEQFFRLDSSRGTSTGGAGLGLAIAKEIVELHGGTISVQSADETILFTVVFPKDRHKIVRN
ncbi:Sensor histidine kinase ResE [bioreactor metagenome]|uniref:histidine kinase n=1 Tax=bioreactor metagenome TaxID=1076179 RepID=A0A645IPP2_9ZZZZ